MLDMCRYIYRALVGSVTSFRVARNGIDIRRFSGIVIRCFMASDYLIDSTFAGVLRDFGYSIENGVVTTEELRAGMRTALMPGHLVTFHKRKTGGYDGFGVVADATNSEAIEFIINGGRRAYWPLSAVQGHWKL